MKNNRSVLIFFFNLTLITGIIIEFTAYAGDNSPSNPLSMHHIASKNVNQSPSLSRIDEKITMKLYIEETNDTSKTDLYNPCPWEDIPLFGAWTKKTAYAIIRDSLGNWIRPAHEATWSSAFPSAVSVSPGPSDSCVIEGLLPARVVIITAKVDQFSLACSTTAHTWTDIFIVRIHGNDTSQIDSLRMNTGQDTTLYALLRSAEGSSEVWQPASANWFIDTSATSEAPPLGASQWSFSPLFPIDGEIMASVKFAPDDSVKETVPFSFQSTGTIYKKQENNKTLLINKTTNSNGTLINILFAKRMNHIEAKIIACNGKVIAKVSEKNSRQITFNPINYSKGMYFLYLSYNNIKRVFKVIIDH